MIELMIGIVIELMIGLILGLMSVIIFCLIITINDANETIENHDDGDV